MATLLSNESGPTGAEGAGRTPLRRYEVNHETREGRGAAKVKDDKAFGRDGSSGMSQGGERAGAETGEARASARPQRGAPNAGSHPSPSAAGKPSKRQKRRRRKTNAPAAPPPGGSALRELPPALGAKVAEAERVLRERKGPPGARPGQGKNRRRRKGRAGFPAAAQPAGAASGRPSPRRLLRLPPMRQADLPRRMVRLVCRLMPRLISAPTIAGS